MTVNPNRVIQTFQKIVALDSESFHERAVADYLINAMGELGIEVMEDNVPEILDAKGIAKKTPESAGNLYAFIKGSTDGEPILFSAHMDTVSPARNKKSIIHDDGTITSDGTTVLGADDVGGLVAILEALRVIKEENLEHPDIEVVFTIAEEAYGYGGIELDYSKIKSKQAYVCDLTGPIGMAAVAAPTILKLTIRIIGKKAHAGFEPEQGINAVAIAASAIAGIKQGWVAEDTSINFGIINGGTASNIVSDEVIIRGEIRSLDDRKAHELADEVAEKFREAAKQYGGGLEFEAIPMVVAYRTEQTEAIVERFRRACEDLALGEAELIQTFGGSDLNTFAQHGITGIVVSSAMQNVHTTKEYTTTDDIIKAAELTLALMKE